MEYAKCIIFFGNILTPADKKFNDWRYEHWWDVTIRDVQYQQAEGSDLCDHSICVLYEEG